MNQTRRGGSTEYLFTGEQDDATLGYTYLRARYYDQAIGRFVSKDPHPAIAKLPQTINRYTYVDNNPVNRTDPSGKIGPIVIGAAVIALDELLFQGAYLGAMVGAAWAGHSLGEMLGGVFASEESDNGPPTPYMGEHPAGQLEERGWAAGEAENAVANPSRTEPRWDNRGQQAEPATRYYDENGNSVTVNDRTGEIIQVSDKNDPDWRDDDNLTPKP